MNSVPATVERTIIWPVGRSMRLKSDVSSAHDRLPKIVDAVKVVRLIVCVENMGHVSLEG